MKNRNETYKRKWLAVFGLVALVEVLDEIESLVFQSEGLLKFILDSIFLLLTMGIIFWMLKGLDVTARELEKNKLRLKNIFDTLDVAIWSHDLRSNTLLITPGIEKLYGYSLDEFYEDYSLWKKVIHPEDVHILFEREQNFLKGEAVTSVYRIIRPDGEVRWIQDRGIPILDHRGQFADFTSVLFDITDRKESEDRYRSLVEMSPDFIAVYSRGKIDYINEAGCKIFGASKLEEIVGLPISRFVPHHILEQIKGIDLALDDEFNEIVRFEFQTLQLDGKSIEVEMSAMPIFYEGRLAKQVVGRDISQRKKAEKTI
ncbi:MAG TPA: PAS domain S-box protein, partial [Pseudoneobacillus sp.]|nr:PAS domain S-box protein [Pseudoneobacillus sp.]